jgi:DNA (cytosine-5)-methyltransferase 1
MKILNLYSGIGGNRKDWSDSHEVVAVENNQEIAEIYSTFFPDDEMVVGDAHDYLARNWRGFDMIWSSPPCQSHSKVRMMASKSGSYDAIMPNMQLWAEIIFLQNFTKNTNIKWVVENVKPYYEPIVKPTQKLGRHLIWSNFPIPYREMKDELTHNQRGSSVTGVFDLRGFKTKHRKDQIIRNSVDPKIGKYIIELVEKN